MNSTLIKIGIGAGIVLAAFVLHQVDRRAAVAEGARDERLVWQERQARDRLAKEKIEADKQAEINRIEADYWRQSATDAVRIRELEEIARDAEMATASAAAADGCAPAVSKKLRDALAPIGRD